MSDRLTGPRGRGLAWLVLGAALLALSGCAGLQHGMDGPPTPTAAGIPAGETFDLPAEADARHLTNVSSLYQIAERIRAEQKPAVMPPKKSVLVLSGGGAYGAYSAGVLIGWTKSGQRPSFDVVTGISTGALIAPLAFLGPEYDDELTNLYTTIRRDDLFTIRKNIRTLFGESLADNTQFVQRVQQSASPTLMAAVAREHAKGRRLYIGTTDLDGRRQVTWDLGAIAQQGTPEALALFQNVILASASIPGFFAPVRIPVSIDGKLYEERHVDGGVSASLFFKPPWVPPAQRSDATANSLYNTDLYVLLAGKLYADPEVVRSRALRIAGSAVSLVIYSQAREELLTLYTTCALTGMNYHVAAIPAATVIKTASTDFDPAEMKMLFNEGAAQVAAGTVWRRTPPGLEPGEGMSQRAGTTLTRVANEKAQPIGPTREDPSIFNPLNGRGLPTRPDNFSK